MAKRKALAPTRATLDQMAQAASALMVILLGDPRVQAVYVAWRDALMRSDDTATAIERNARDDALVERLVRDQLGLAYRWLPNMLLLRFADIFVQQVEVMTYSGIPLSELPPRSGHRFDPLWELRPDVEADVPAGRAAKNRGAHIARTVEWLYRAKIKRDRETVYAIAKDYATREHNAGVWVSVVQQGIAHAEQLLAHFAVDDAAI